MTSLRSITKLDDNLWAWNADFNTAQTYATLMGRLGRPHRRKLIAAFKSAPKTTHAQSNTGSTVWHQLTNNGGGAVARFWTMSGSEFQKVMGFGSVPATSTVIFDIELAP